MLHDVEFATVVTAKKPGRFIALCDGKHFAREQSATHARLIAVAPNCTYAAGNNPGNAFERSIAVCPIAASKGRTIVPADGSTTMTTNAEAAVKQVTALSDARID